MLFVHLVCCSIHLSSFSNCDTNDLNLFAHNRRFTAIDAASFTSPAFTTDETGVQSQGRRTNVKSQTVLKYRSIIGRTDDILKDLFPPHIAELLMRGEKVPPERKEMITMYFRSNLSSKLKRRFVYSSGSSMASFWSITMIARGNIKLYATLVNDTRVISFFLFQWYCRIHQYFIVHNGGESQFDVGPSLQCFRCSSRESWGLQGRDHR